MKIKRVVVIFCCAFAFKLIVSCISPCPEKLGYAYRHSSLHVDGLNNSGSEPVLAQDNVPKKAFGIRLTFLLEELAVSDDALPSLFSVTYADECGPDFETTSIDTIVSFRVYTLTKFDATHDSDSDVSDYFRLRSYETTYEPISKFVDDSDRFLYFNFSEDTKVIDVFLLTPPESNGTYNFKIDIEFSDGRILSAITNPIVLN